MVLFFFCFPIKAARATLVVQVAGENPSPRNLMTALHYNGVFVLVFSFILLLFHNREIELSYNSAHTHKDDDISGIVTAFAHLKGTHLVLCS